mgnify:CR=1 FL=1
MRYNTLLWLGLLCISFCACDKDENNNSNNFATGIVELPALRNGANDVFVTHYTTFNGQKVTSFSMEYDKSKKHSRWIAFRFDNQTKQQNVSRSDEPLMQILLSVHNTNVCKQILGNKVMIEGIFVLLPTDFIRVR